MRGINAIAARLPLQSLNYNPELSHDYAADAGNCHNVYRTFARVHRGARTARRYALTMQKALSLLPSGSRK